MACIHWSGLKSEGLKTEGLAVPSPHSWSRKVLVEKWMMTPNSRSCQATCCGAGLMSGKLCAVRCEVAERRARASDRTRKDFVGLREDIIGSLQQSAHQSNRIRGWLGGEVRGVNWRGEPPLVTHM